MGLPSHTGASGPREPVTYSRRVTPANKGYSRSVTSSNGEANGEDADDRIAQEARRGIRTGAQRAAKMLNVRSTQGKLPARVGSLKMPSVSLAKTAQNVDAVRHEGTRSTKSKLKTDTEETIVRSLADSVPPFLPLPAPKTEDEYDSDVAKAKILSMFAIDEPPKPSSNTLSYRTLGSGSTSNATAPHARLYGLHNVMEKSVEALEEVDDDERPVDVNMMAVAVRKWGGTILKTINAIEAAEGRRIKDLKRQLDFDREIEEKHQKKLETSNKMWDLKMRQKEQEWKKKLEEQKQAYEAQLAGHKVTKASPPSQEQPLNDQPRTACPPSPHAQEEVTRLTKEIAILKAEHEAALQNIESISNAAATFLKQKAERLADQNAELRKAHKTSDDERIYETARTKRRYETQIQQLQEDTARLRIANAKLILNRQGTNNREGVNGRDGGVDEREKMDVDDEVQLEDKTATASKKLGQDKKQLNGHTTGYSPARSKSLTTPNNPKSDNVTSVKSEERVNRRTLHSVFIPRPGSQVSPGKRKLANGEESRSEGASWSPKKAKTTGSMQ
jgi:hypothetical protein